MTQRSVLPDLDEKPVYVNSMFARIAPTYDRMNRLMTLGQDQRWRRDLLRLCNLPPRGSLLDVGTGTGDIGYEAKRLHPGANVVASDFTFEMMAAGQHKVPSLRLPFVQADAFHLPFDDDAFDAVTSAFLVRNVVDRTAVFKEMARVTKPGGRVVCLETAPPTNAFLEPLFRLYFFRAVPLLGQLISGDGAAYSYLPQSTVDFPPPGELKQHMERAGLQNVVYSEKMFGTVVIHVGMKLAYA